MEKMLINGTQNEELRVALVKDDYLYDLDIERAGQSTKKSNIYKGKITRIEPSLEAAFVEYGADRQGFLPLKEIAPEYFLKDAPAVEERPNLKELISVGQEIMVQIDKDERGTKGAALTTYITLAGCYLVLMPNNPRAGGISRRIAGEERDEIKDALRSLEVPDGMGLIVRTAGLGKSQDDLQWDLEVLLQQWKNIEHAYTQVNAPYLVQQEGDVIIRSIRDNLRKSVEEVIIDNQEVFIKIKNYLQSVRPDFLSRLKLYQDNLPLFNRYRIESQIETAYQREVLLPSGGSIVIDRTEALVSIDINSAKATSGNDIETTALNTNLEAAVEIARQLRLRDLGGLIVIDFIDMTPIRNQREVENRLREALRDDRARIQIGRISRFGLLEMSRQRLRPALSESSQSLCPRCQGRGTIRSIESLALSMVRLIEEEALKEYTLAVQVQFPVEMAAYILNEKRQLILNIEKRHRIDIVVVPNPHLETPQYKMARVKGEESGRKTNSANSHPLASYQLISEPETHIPYTITSEANEESRIPLIREPVTPPRPASYTGGFLKRLLSNLFKSEEESSRPATAAPKPSEKPREASRNPRSSSETREYPRSGQQDNRRFNKRNPRSRGSSGNSGGGRGRHQGSSGGVGGQNRRRYSQQQPTQNSQPTQPTTTKSEDKQQN